jgi:hypothetical protein
MNTKQSLQLVLPNVFTPETAPTKSTEYVVGTAINYLQAANAEAIDASAKDYLDEKMKGYQMLSEEGLRAKYQEILTKYFDDMKDVSPHLRTFGTSAVLMSEICISAFAQAHLAGENIPDEPVELERHIGLLWRGRIEGEITIKVTPDPDFWEYLKEVDTKDAAAKPE